MRGQIMHPHPPQHPGASGAPGRSSAATARNGAPNTNPNPDLPPHSDDVDEERRRVLLALGAVFSAHGNRAGGPQPAALGGGDAALASSRDAADRYLTSFQRHPASWMVCDRLLRADDSSCSSSAAAAAAGAADPAANSLQARFFAAQTLHAKCRTDVAQLPPESLPSLRDSLMNHFTSHARLLREGGGPGGGAGGGSGSSRALVTRLGMALSSLAVQMGWFAIIPDVLGNVLGPRPELAPAVLELFKLLPEECCSDRLVLVDEGRRREFGDRLRDSSAQILDFLLRTARGSAAAVPAAAGELTKECVLGTLHSWVRYVEMPPSLLEKSPLLEWTFSSLEAACVGAGPHHHNDGDSFEVAVDVVVELLRQYPSDLVQNTPLVHRMIPLAMALGRPSDDGPFRKALREEDEDVLRGYCRIFTEMGESYMSLIMSHEELNQTALVDLVLDCSAIPDKEIAGITLHFWYRFVSWLESLEPLEFRYMQIDHFTPQLLRLLSICSCLLQYPPDIDTLQEDRVDDINRERYYVAETVEDCCRLLGGNVVLHNLGERLKEECQRVSSLPPQRQLSEWHGIEACLYAIRSVSRYISDDEIKVLPFVMGLVPQLPPNVHQLRCTASLTIGNYALWLDSHTVHLQPLMPYLAQGLSLPQCASASAVAIKELCESCNKQMSLGDPVLQLYDGIIAAQELHQAGAPGGGAASGGGALALKDELEVLEGACKAISKQLTDQAASGQPETTSNYLNRLVQPIGTRLAAIAAPGGHYGARQATAEVERLTVVIRFLDLPHVKPGAGAAAVAAASGLPKLSSKTTFIMDLMSESWNLLDAISQKFPHDIHLAEKLCRLHKHVMRGCGPKVFRPLLEPLCTQLVRNFATSRLSPYLYAASICVSEYSRDADAIPLLFGMITKMSEAVFGMLRTPDDFTAHPDVVEEFFFLAGRMMSYCPEPLVVSPLMNSLLQCAAVGMKLDHRDANSGTLNFLENTVSYGLRLGNTGRAADPKQQACKSALENAIVKEGQPVVTNLAAALLGDLPLYRLDNGRGSIAGVLFKLNELCPGLLMQWLNPALTQAPGQAKEVFLRSLANRVSRDEFDASVRQFTSVCERSRKLRGHSPAQSARHAT